MMDVMKGADGVPTPVSEAIEWFVSNGSDRELDEVIVLQWEEWCTHVWNNAAYADIVRMYLQIPRLPVPTGVSREDLLKDVLAEDGAESHPQGF
jgi:hypothetical protein